MKKKLLLLIAAIIVALSIISTIGPGTDPDTAGTQTPGDTLTSPVSESDILSILFHQPYLEAVDIHVNHESERKKMPAKISKALDQEPKRVKQEDGGMFGTGYYTLTNQSNYESSSVYCYYGKLKDNKPDGFGVLAHEPVDLNDLASVKHLI